MPLFSAPLVGPAATVLARTALPPAIVQQRIADDPLPQIFLGWGPFPAVREVQGQTGRWDHVGATRRLLLGDGGEVVETVVEHTAGVGFAYELTGFTDVFRVLVHGVRGEWTFTPDGAGTIIHWTWEFRARFGRRLIMAAVVGPLWRRSMQRMIRVAVRRAERA